MKIRSPLTWLPVACLLLAGLANAQTIEEVGDPDSFGRDVTYLGIAGANSMLLLKDCSTLITPGLQCTNILPAPATTEFSFSDLDSIQLPARASNSLLCFAMTPLIQRSFRNDTSTAGLASLFARAILTLESPVLENPALINAVTGQPFDGKIEITLVAHNEGWRLQPQDLHSSTTQLTRACQAALVSKRALIDAYGLTQSQANSFFNNRITVRLGASVTARFVDFLGYSYGIRLYGDRR